MDCPVRWSQGNGLPSAVVTRHPLRLGKSVQSQSRAPALANPICKCRRHKAGHLQVRVAVGRQSTCVLKEAPLKKGPLGLPQTIAKQKRNRGRDSQPRPRPRLSSQPQGATKLVKRGHIVRDGETTIKIKFAVLRGWAFGGREENRPKNAVFRGKRHDNKILKVRILLSRILLSLLRRSHDKATPWKSAHGNF